MPQDDQSVSQLTLVMTVGEPFYCNLKRFHPLVDHVWEDDVDYYFSCMYHVSVCEQLLISESTVTARRELFIQVNPSVGVL